MYHVEGTRAKDWHAGAGNGTFTGTYSDQHRPLHSAPAQHFVVHMYGYGGTRGKRRRAGNGNGHAPGRIPININR